MSSEQKYDIEFSGLAAGIHGFEWSLNSAFFGERNNDEILEAELVSKVILEKKQRMMSLQFLIAGKVKVVCDHCGDDLMLPLKCEEEIIARFAPETDLSGDDVIYLGDSEFKLDVSQYLYEIVLLSLPAKKIHPEGKCNPEVERYFIQEEIEEEIEMHDPRWKALEKLKKNSLDHGTS